MGRRGPPPKPTILKLVPGGNPGRRAIPSAEPVPAPGEPEVPSFVHEDPAARAIWDQLVPRLARIGLARSIDGLSLGRYCVILAQWAAGVRFLRENGRTHVLRAEGKGGKPGPIIASKQRPEVPDTARLAQQLIALEREFGLTPAARTRIRTEMDQQAKGDANELKRRFFAGPNAAPA